MRDVKKAAEDWEENQTDYWFENTEPSEQVHLAFTAGAEWGQQHPNKEVMKEIKACDHVWERRRDGKSCRLCGKCEFGD